MQMNPSEQFAAHVAEARYEDLPDPIVARAKERLADSVGVMSAGARGVGIPGMVDMAKAWGGAEQASIFNYGDKVPAHVAAFVNSLQLRSFDFEAIDAEGFLTRWPAHVTSTTVPAALALAEWKAMSGKDFLLAMLLGDDMACRLTEATRFDPLGCFDGNGTANCLGATAIASKALGLGAEQTLAAFGIALNMAGGTMQNTQGFWTFKLGNALSAYHGIFAAEMALNGFKGLDDPITGPKCFMDMFAKNGDASELLKELGERYFSDAVVKPWACCRGNHVVLDAARECLHGRTLDAKEVRKVRFGATKSLTNGEFPFGSTCECDGLFNRRFTLSTYILTGQVVAASYAPEWMTSPELKDMLDKLEFYEWNPLAGAKGSGGFAACIDIELEDGETLHGEVKGDILGDVERKPLPKEEFEAKFETNAAFGGKVDVGRLREAYDMAWNIEQVDDMSTFTKLLLP